MGRFSKRTIGACLAVLAVGLLAGGCDWVQFGAYSGLNGDNAADTAITPSNVSTLAEQFSASDASTGAVTPQAEVNGILYVSNANGIEAYSATGSTGCAGSPTTCTPLWTYQGASVPASDGVAVLNGVLYVTTASALEAFDATGHTNCAGTPTTCSPLWHAPLALPSAPTVSNGTVYLTASDTLDAFDAKGVTNCARGVCAPVWTANDVYSDVAVSAGIAYVFGGGNAISAFDANGIKGCSGTPKVCTPLWAYLDPTFTSTDPINPEGPASTWGYPVVSGSSVYLDTFDQVGAYSQGGIEAYDASGVTNCGGTPTVCSPLWTGEGGSRQAPLVGGGFEFLAILNGLLGAGEGQNPAWLSTVAAAPVAVAGSVVYGAGGGEVTAFDVNGCGGEGFAQCAPLWTAPGTDAIVANGTVYVSTTNASGKGEIVAYGLA
jgi:hypothetical protein